TIDCANGNTTSLAVSLIVALTQLEKSKLTVSLEMDDGSQKLLDVIDDPSALESFLGLSAAAAGEALSSSSRTTLESLVDSLQQGLLDPSSTAGGGNNSARHAPAGTPQTGSLVLTQHQLGSWQQFQASGRPQGQAVTFTLPPQYYTFNVFLPSALQDDITVVVSSAPSVVTSSSTHHFVLTPFHHASGGNTVPHPSSHPITLINPPGQQGSGTLVSTAVSQPSSSFITASTAGTISHLANPNIAIGHGGAIITTSTAGLHVGGTVPSTGMPVIGSNAGNPSMPNLASNSTAGSSIFGASIIPAGNSSTGSGVLVGPSGTTVFTPTISSPGSPFSIPTRSPAPHAPPTPSPSPLPLRSPASVPSHHPPSPAPSPYHTQLQSPQQQPQPQQPSNVANTSYILSTNASQTASGNILKEHYGSLPHSVSSSQTPSSFVLSAANAAFKTLPSGLALSGAGQFPVIPPGSTTMLQGNHQLVQIIHHHTGASQTSTFPAHTQIITTGPGGTVPLQQAATAVGGPPKPKQPPQILPKPPSGQPTGSSHSKIAANARATASTQHQGIHAQHHTTASAAQVVIGQANPTAVIPAAQAGALLLKLVIPGLAPSGPMLVPNPSGSVQLILRSPTPGTQTAASTQGNQHRRQQMPQVLRLITAQGPIQLQQIQTPSGPTFIAVPSGQTLSFQQLGPRPSTPHQQQSTSTPVQLQQSITNPGFPIIRHNTTVLPVQQHQCTATNTDQTSIIMPVLQKKKPKKKKKKKKDEEPKMDLANIMKLSGIGDDEDLALYESEEQQMVPSSQSPAPVEQTPTNQQQTVQQQSQLIAQLRSPTQIPVQVRLSVYIIYIHTHTHIQIFLINIKYKQTAANIVLQNLPSSVSQQQNVATAQNQLSALLAASGTSGNTSNHVVLSQLLQQTSPPGLPPHMMSNTNTRVTNSNSPSSQISTATSTIQSHPQPQERFTMLHHPGKPGFPKDSFNSGELSNSNISKLDGNMTNSSPSSFGIQTKSTVGPLGCPNFRDGFVQPSSNKVDSSTSTCSKPPSTPPPPPPPNLIVANDNSANLLLTKSPHQHQVSCQPEVSLKPPHDTIHKQNSATTQTDIVHPTVHLGNKQQDSMPFLSASKPNTDGGPTFLGLHPFSTIQGLVSTTGATVPFVTTPVMTSGGSNFGGEQLLIAHHGGMSVLAAPQLIQCLQQAQNAAPGIINMPQLHLTQNAINKAIGQGLAINTQAGTILIGGSPETFSATMNNQHKPSIVTATNNTAATKLLSQQPSVLLQQLNAGSGAGTTSAVRRCSSDSNNSSISIGSPPPGGGTAAVIGLINQPVVTQNSPSVTTSAGPRKNQQSIETQTISLGIPTTTNNYPNSFLDAIAHSHSNLVLGKLGQPNTTMAAGKKKKPKQQRSTKILPVVTTASRQCNSTGTTTDPIKSPLQERNFAKPNTICQGTQHVARILAHETSSYVTSPPFTLGQQTTRNCNTSAMTTVPPLTTICTVGSTATTTVTTTTMLQSVVSKVATNLNVQPAMGEVSTNNSHHNLSPAVSKHHCMASQTVSMQQSQSGLVPHLVPIPPSGSAGTSPMSSIIQKVQTIQLTPQNQKHLKAVQMQIPFGAG
ncbi:hypothetical protein L9F63_022664, partial [Diploptera punctata]